MFSLPPTDRAFQYGDGLFETIHFEAGRLWFWSDHYDRLTSGMRALSLPLPADFNADFLQNQLLNLIEQNSLTQGPARVKIQVWRQTGGLYTPTSTGINWLLTARPGTPFALTEKHRTGFFSDVRLSPSAISSCKTLNALPYVLAGLYRQQHTLDEIILLDTHGHLAECGAANLFWLKNDQLFTPSLESGCINGIIRRQLLRNQGGLPQPVQEGLFLPPVLDTADAVFCVNVSGMHTLLGTPPAAVQNIFSTLFPG